MSVKLRESVTAVFINRKTKNIFTIKRQDYLSVFPGYTSFPGGKVDKSDHNNDVEIMPSCFGDDPHLWHALKREVKEELDFDLQSKAVDKSKIFELGVAITPEFNPYRFKVYFYGIVLDEDIQFSVDSSEAVFGGWLSSTKLLELYESAQILAVPPIVEIIKTLGRNISHTQSVDLTLIHNEATDVPMIESICGVKQFLPLSNTFPPANRTNCFIIGDDRKFLIDPSPKNEDEFKKLIRGIRRVGIDAILITHHHADHHEFINELAEGFNCPILMSKRTHELMNTKFGASYLSGNISIHYVREGDILTTSCGSDVLIYEIPGHDAGQIGLAPKSMNWFLVGDLIQTIGTVVIGAPEGDMGQYFKSLERVIKLCPRICIPSHGIAIGGVHKLKQTLKHRKHREQQIIKLLNEKKSEQEILDIIYEGLDEKLLKYAKKTITAHISKIEAEGN